MEKSWDRACLASALKASDSTTFEEEERTVGNPEVELAEYSKTAYEAEMDSRDERGKEGKNEIDSDLFDIALQKVANKLKDGV